MPRTHVSSLRIGATALLAAAGWGGCGGTQSATEGLTYHKDVKAIVDDRCLRCHEPGGIGPFTLTSAEDLVKHKSEVKFAVNARTMPPWPPGKGCNEFVGDRSLSEAQVKTIVDWVDQGAAVGQPNQYKPLSSEPPPKLSRIDRHLQMPIDYTPKVLPDEYRCFVLDWPDKAVTYITGSNSIPGNKALVHHVIAFLATPDLAPEAERLDAADPAPGYTCFGGVGLRAKDGSQARVGLVGGWAPGSLGNDQPAGTGIKILPGSKIILQVHYNMSAAKPGPDRTAIDFKVDEKVEKEAMVLPWSNFVGWVRGKQMVIPAGAADQMYDFAIDPTGFFKLFGDVPLKEGEPFTIYSANLHMHTRGTRARLEIKRQSGESQCLLEIPKWDFHWQGNYGFRQPTVFKPGDKLSIECHWNNSAANQPIVDGKRVEPRELNWGEGTGDEMCIGFLYVTR